VSALGATFSGARNKAYEAVNSVGFDGKQIRTDIASEPARSD
jgi:phosphoribosylamine-glycine ligase